MTTNVTFGNTAQFVAEFIDINGNITVPFAATLNIVYPVGVTTVSTFMAMTLQNSFFTATWFSSVSDLGIATWNITSIGASSAAAQGNLRIITP